MMLKHLQETANAQCTHHSFVAKLRINTEITKQKYRKKKKNVKRKVNFS